MLLYCLTTSLNAAGPFKYKLKYTCKIPDIHQIRWLTKCHSKIPVLTFWEFQRSSNRRVLESNAKITYKIRKKRKKCIETISHN